MKKILIVLLIISILSITCVTSFAATTSLNLPQFNDIWDDWEQYDYALIVREFNIFKLFFFDGKPFLEGTSVRHNSNETNPYVEFYYVADTDSWELERLASNTREWNKDVILWSSVDIDGVIDYDENLFPNQDDKTWWDKLTSLNSFAFNIMQDIRNLPTNLFLSFKQSLDDTTNAINAITGGVIEGIKSIFIPDTSDLQESISDFVEDVTGKFGLDTSKFEALFTNSSPVDDVYVFYDIPNVTTFRLKILDASFINTGVDYFRPIIQGFLMLLLLFYNVKQFIGFFGYDAGIIGGRNDLIKETRENSK